MAQMTNDVIDRINRRITKPLSVLKKQEPMLGSDWAERYFYLSQESSAEQGPWQSFPYQKAMLNLMCNDDIPEVTIQKSVRVGYTKMIVATCMYSIFRHRAVVTWQPTDAESDRFCKVEVDTAIRDSPYIRDMFKSDPDRRSSNNTLAYKGFIGASWDLRGGTSAKNFAAMTKDTGVYDELDRCPLNVDNEGSGVDLGDQRLAASSFPKSIRGSTPKLKDTSQIEKLRLGADVQLYRFIPCTHCFHMQRLQWSGMVFDSKDYHSVRYQCESCDVLIPYSDYAEMDMYGVWRTIDGEHYCDESGNIRGRKGEVEDVRHVSIFIWGAYSYLKPWSDMVRMFLKANIANKLMGDRTSLQTFTNTVLAETWDEHQGERVSWEIIKARAESYALWTVPAGGTLLIASVDTQDDRLELLIEAYGAGEECWTVGHAVIHGDPFTAEPWAELDEYLSRLYEHESGAMLHIADCGIDSGGHRTQAVYDYVRRSKHRVFALKGMSTPGKPAMGRPKPQDVTYGGTLHKHGIKLWPVGSDTLKAVMYGRYKITSPGPGYWHTPIGLPDSFYQQATAEKIVTRMVKGFPVQEWYCTTRNEITDLKAYCYATAVKNGLVRINWEKRSEKLQKSLEKTTFAKNRKTLSGDSSPCRPQIDSTLPYL